MKILRNTNMFMNMLMMKLMMMNLENMNIYMNINMKNYQKN